MSSNANNRTPHLSPSDESRPQEEISQSKQTADAAESHTPIRVQINYFINHLLQ